MFWLHYGGKHSLYPLFFGSFCATYLLCACSFAQAKLSLGLAPRSRSHQPMLLPSWEVGLFSELFRFRFCWPHFQFAHSSWIALPSHQQLPAALFLLLPILALLMKNTRQFKYFKTIQITQMLVEEFLAPSSLASAEPVEATNYLFSELQVCYFLSTP